ncbi:hypothetical protein KEM48_011669 [Puccinia striiformis f. sp. tritici PST-130]|nr:hypothetical protein KEM48_011669 [Puccinia striiformis f. sp. tritici PST-130]
MILISHLQADHHCGLPSLLAKKSKLDNCVPLALIIQYGINLSLNKIGLKRCDGVRLCLLSGCGPDNNHAIQQF